MFFLGTIQSDWMSIRLEEDVAFSVRDRPTVCGINTGWISGVKKAWLRVFVEEDTVALPTHCWPTRLPVKSKKFNISNIIPCSIRQTADMFIRECVSFKEHSRVATAQVGGYTISQSSQLWHLDFLISSIFVNDWLEQLSGQLGTASAWRESFEHQPLVLWCAVGCGKDMWVA